MALAAGRRLAAACNRTVVVIRPDDAELHALLAAEGLHAVVSDKAEQGMGHSLSAGVASTADAAGWLIALADMPYIQPASYRAVVASLQQGATLSRPLYRGRPGHPVGFGAVHLPELLALTGGQGGKAILAARRNDLHFCAVEDPGVLEDVDHPSGMLVF
jgi:molybdenum cofactor cytidylyltransferase